MGCSSLYSLLGRTIVTIHKIEHEADGSMAPGEVKVNGMDVSRKNPMLYFTDVETEAQKV